jgi:hypothetical protein
MFVGLLPRGILEAMMLLVILFVGFLVIRSVRRRRAFAKVTPDEGVDLPSLTTQQRIAGTVRRLWRDPAQGVWLVEVAPGKRKITFCMVDYADKSEQYQGLIGKQADIALDGLATLAPGGVDAIRDRIKDIDKVDITPGMVRLVPAGQYANDYAVIGRVLSHREEIMDDLPLTVYRSQVIHSTELTLVVDLAVQKEETAPFADQTMVHGSARLYGYLP